LGRLDLAGSYLVGVAMRRAVVHDAPDLVTVVSDVPPRAPDAGDAEFPASTGFVVVWAIHFSPGMSAADLDPPAIVLGVSQSRFHFGFGVPFPWHWNSDEL
jgi:hypothetical protein